MIACDSPYRGNGLAGFKVTYNGLVELWQEVQESLAAALDRNRGATLCKLVSAVAESALRKDVRDSRQRRMCRGTPTQRLAMLQEGRRAAHLVNMLGNAVLFKRPANAEVVDIAAELVELGQFTQVELARICDEVKEPPGSSWAAGGA